MNDQLPIAGAGQQLKRNVAYKLLVGSILSGKQNFEEERLRNIEVNGKNVVRVNLIANVVDKFIQEGGEKKYGSLTLDDATGQIRVKLFGEDVSKFEELNQGDTVLVVGLIKFWSNEIYIAPEIMKKKDPAFLLVRKLEVEAEAPQTLDSGKIAQLKDKILTMVKEAEKDGGIDIDKIILELKEPPEIINNEIKKLLEDGVAYEPRPGKLRYLG
ncbi:MAG: OB-fold nucleic acid binding domain-containing protein [Nanoarchaeota archaeon]|nr:OB-fold nucleic acid binding domain-containing protein [Nanoarchaeota archaeon]MBU1051802.1 OB-fold nucleic acid binding domain-containing protein [Nanoarchaeota archaeon]MBU1989066.1 OB-fold nucleic acid binding domain-containing protein [Nanoarchaeota archaeon]